MRFTRRDETYVIRVFHNNNDTQHCLDLFITLLKSSNYTLSINLQALDTNLVKICVEQG